MTTTKTHLDIEARREFWQAKIDAHETLRKAEEDAREALRQAIEARRLTGNELPRDFETLQLTKMAEQYREGAPVVTVYLGGRPGIRDATETPGVLLGRTRTKATILTEKGKFDFRLVGTRWKDPGERMGEHRVISMYVDADEVNRWRRPAGNWVQDPPAPSSS